MISLKLFSGSIEVYRYPTTKKPRQTIYCLGFTVLFINSNVGLPFEIPNCLLLNQSSLRGIDWSVSRLRVAFVHMAAMLMMPMTIVFILDNPSCHTAFVPTVIAVVMFV
ncbi:MAG: hypothetical protein V2I33_09490, partial [Kangiellaceae bacterium]|nr:hypothetical protein [Kangiellaceae bacterium]